MSDTAQVVGEILAGGHDGKVLEIIQAIQTRMATGATQTYWRIRWDDDLEVTEHTITAGEMRTVCQLLSAARGQRVVVTDLHPEADPGDLIAVVSTVLQTRRGVPLPEATRQIEATPMAYLMGKVDLYEVPPPAEGARPPDPKD